jgi:hypothetical protein
LNSSYFGNYTLKKCWNWHNEVQTRFFANDALNDGFLIRNGIGYNLNEDNNNILLGYAWIGGFDATPHREHRIYQQYITKQRFGPIFVLHRYRFEQQIFPSHFQVRLRYFLAVNYSLNKPSVTKGAIYLSAYNEIFLKPATRSLDRNRLYGGIGYAFTDEIKVEASLLHQAVNEHNQYLFQVVLFKTFGFDKQR